MGRGALVPKQDWRGVSGVPKQGWRGVSGVAETWGVGFTRLGRRALQLIRVQPLVNYRAAFE